MNIMKSIISIVKKHLNKPIINPFEQFALPRIFEKQDENHNPRVKAYPVREFVDHELLEYALIHHHK